MQRQDPAPEMKISWRPSVTDIDIDCSSQVKERKKTVFALQRAYDFRRRDSLMWVDI